MLLVKTLFGVDLGDSKPAPTLERLITLWNKIEETIKAKFNKAGIEYGGHTYYWEEGMKAAVVKPDDIQLFMQLRMLRNQQVHSTEVDRKQVELAVHMAEKLLASIS